MAKKQRKPSIFTYAIAALITVARTGSKNRIDNAREEQLKATAADRRMATIERVMRIRVMDEQRKLIRTRRLMLDNPDNNPGLLLGATIDACPDCGLTHSPQLNLTNCTDCGTQLSPILLDV